MPEAARCHHPGALGDIDPIWGYDIFYTAEVMRESHTSCGHDAIWFKPISN